MECVKSIFPEEGKIGGERRIGRKKGEDWGRD